MPSEMVSTHVMKATTKDARGTIKTMRLSVSCMREAKATSLRRLYEAIKFNNDESINDFNMHLSSLVTRHELLGRRARRGPQVPLGLAQGLFTDGLCDRDVGR